MAKLVRRDLTVEPYARAKHFRVDRFPVNGIAQLSKMLQHLEKQTGACVIRGAPKFDCPANDRRRIKADFEDRPCHIIMLDVDGFSPQGDPIKDPETCIWEFVDTCLPACFHKASFHWQLSNSAGLPGKEQKLKVHLWFWLRTPHDSATLRAWATKEKISVDVAVFDPIQIHYTANPVFEDPTADPIPVRSGFYPADDGDCETVDLEIDVSGLDIRAHRTSPPGETFATEDPVWDWMCENWDTFSETGSGALIISCPFEADHSSGQAGDTSTVYFRAGSNGYREGGFSCKHSSCLGAKRRREDYLLKMGYPLFGALVGLGAPTAGGVPALQRDRSGAVALTYGNILHVLADPDAGGMRLRYDDFLDCILWAPDDDEERPLVDRDLVEIIRRLERLGFKTPARDTVRACAEAVAFEQKFDSGRRWVAGLVWDGVPRVHQFCARYLGSADTDYMSAVSAYLFTALAGRLFEPGVKADMVPILVGPQAAGKSTAVAALVPDPGRFFREVSFNESEADLARRLKGVMVAELAELSGLRRRDLETIKALISRTNDCWVPKYKESETSYPRRAVFIGTTNEDEFLADPTGDRRFLPVVVGMIDLEAIRRDRDQLWAEGLQLFRRGGVAWEHAQRLAPAVHQDHRITDSWGEAVSGWIAQQTREQGTERFEFTTADVLKCALGFDIRLMKKPDEMRASNVIRQLGCQKLKMYRGGRRVNGWTPPT